MSEKPKLFDPACLDLAQSFLNDSTCPDYQRGEHATALAQEIQDVIESYINHEESTGWR